jgi:hypothetical protein
MRRWQESSAGLRHVDTTRSAHPAKGARSCGQILWATEVGNCKVGLAWSWTCLHDDVVVMTDPMRVTTNLALVDDESGEPLSASALMRCLNDVIYALPWQDKIRTAA